MPGIGGTAIAIGVGSSVVAGGLKSMSQEGQIIVLCAYGVALLVAIAIMIDIGLRPYIRDFLAKRRAIKRYHAEKNDWNKYKERPDAADWAHYGNCGISSSTPYEIELTRFIK